MKTTFPPHGRALLHQTPAGAVVIVENGTAVTHLFFSRIERTVWKALQAIPYGETRSYGDIARRIGRPSACRAVGQANNRNPVGIIIPCHRVIGADGKLTGYASGLTIKQYLLELEQGSTTPFTLFMDMERMPGNTPASP